MRKLLLIEQEAIDFVQIATKPTTWTEVHHCLGLGTMICHLHCAILQNVVTTTSFYQFYTLSIQKSRHRVNAFWHVFTFYINYLKTNGRNQCKRKVCIL